LPERPAVEHVPPTLTGPAFQANWRGIVLTERAAAQPHFIDVCRLVGHPTPTETDPAPSMALSSVVPFGQDAGPRVPALGPRHPIASGAELGRW
jgi:hypothetical protein